MAKGPGPTAQSASAAGSSAAGASSSKTRVPHLLGGDDICEILEAHRLAKGSVPVQKVIQAVVDDVATKIIMAICTYKKESLGSSKKLSISAEDVECAMAMLGQRTDIEGHEFFAHMATLRVPLGDGDRTAKAAVSSAPRAAPANAPSQSQRHQVTQQAAKQQLQQVTQQAAKQQQLLQQQQQQQQQQVHYMQFTSQQQGLHRSMGSIAIPGNLMPNQVLQANSLPYTYVQPLPQPQHQQQQQQQQHAFGATPTTQRRRQRQPPQPKLKQQQQQQQQDETKFTNVSPKRPTQQVHTFRKRKIKAEPVTQTKRIALGLGGLQGAFIAGVTSALPTRATRNEFLDSSVKVNANFLAQ